MTDQPLFSIITVTYNAAEVIRPTLDSLRAQTYTDFEHVVIDGASTDATLRIVADHGVAGATVISEPDHGLYDAMNKGIDRSRGRYLMFLNAGDALHAPDTLAILARTISESGNPGIVYGQTDIVGPDRRRLGPRHLIAPSHLTLQSFADGMVVCHQAFVVLRSIAPMFNLRYRLSADYEWCIRCLQHSQRNAYASCTTIDYLEQGLSTDNRGHSLAERFSIMRRYYGLWPTVWRHLKFIPRFVSRRRLERSWRTIDPTNPEIKQL